MKRILSLLLTAALLLTPVLTLTSCATANRSTRRLLALEETERGYALYEMLFQGLTDIPSFKVSTHMDFSAKADGRLYKSKYTALSVCLNQNTPGRTEYYEEVYEISPEGTYGNIYGYRSVDGYTEGHLFRSREETFNGKETYRSTAKSPLPYEEYIEEYTTPAENVLPAINGWDCETVTCRRQEDGTWQATFGGMNPVGLSELDYEYGMDLSYVNELTYLADAEVTVTATPDLLIDRILVSLFYGDQAEDDPEAEPRYTVSYELTFAYEASADEISLDLSDYEDSGDLTVADDFFTHLEKLANAPEGALTTDSHTTTTADGETTVVISRYDVKYDTHKGRFTLEDEGVEGMEGQEYAYRSVYEDGVLSFYATDPETGETYRDEFAMDDDEARAILGSIICYEDLVADYVMSIETLDARKGKYRLLLGAGLKETYRFFYRDMKGSMSDFEAWVDIVMTEDALLSYEYHVRVEGFTEDFDSHTYETVVSCVFKNKTDTSEQV